MDIDIPGVIIHGRGIPKLFRGVYVGSSNYPLVNIQKKLIDYGKSTIFNG
jgi:hypothetical protein